jgi:hypothetical protein
MNTKCGFPVVRTNALIFNGQETSHGQWPWHAAIYQHKGFDIIYNCGGSFVGTKTIITGNSCYICANNLKQFNDRFQMRKQPIDLSLFFPHSYVGVFSKIMK